MSDGCLTSKLRRVGGRLRLGEPRAIGRRGAGVVDRFGLRRCLRLAVPCWASISILPDRVENASDRRSADNIAKICPLLRETTETPRRRRRGGDPSNALRSSFAPAAQGRAPATRDWLHAAPCHPRRPGPRHRQVAILLDAAGRYLLVLSDRLMNWPTTSRPASACRRRRRCAGSRAGEGAVAFAVPAPCRAGAPLSRTEPGSRLL